VVAVAGAPRNVKSIYKSVNYGRFNGKKGAEITLNPKRSLGFSKSCSEWEVGLD